MNGESDPVKILTSFCVDNQKLDELEALLSEFNIFEAAGLVREEIRHSRFLSFILDPQGPHGLGELFATRLLQSAVKDRSPEEVGVTALELELMNLMDLVVAVEKQHIDILLSSPSNRFAVIIENKVGSNEHSNQLSRYLTNVQALHPDWRTLPILLSPRGVVPSDDRYFPVSYEQIADILRSILDSKRTVLGPDVIVALSHYEKLIRRHLVTDSKLTELCEQIISKHRRAIELLVEHLGDPKQRLWAITDKLFEENGFVRTEKRWLPKQWLEWMPASSEAPSGYVAAFWVDVYSSRVRLILELQPGDETHRKRLFKAAKDSKAFKVKRKEMTDKWSRIYDLELAVSREPLGDPIEWESGIASKFQNFVSNTLPILEQELRDSDKAE